MGGNNSTPAANTPSVTPSPPVDAVRPSSARSRSESPSQYGSSPDPEPKSNATNSEVEEPQNKPCIKFRAKSAVARPNQNDSVNTNNDDISSSVVYLRVEDTELKNLLRRLFVRVLDELLIDQLELNVGITCDGCHASDFFGYRYKCCLCANYDLCADCFELKKFSEFHRPSHPMLFIKSPLSRDGNKRLAKIFNMGTHAVDKLFSDSVFSTVTCDICYMKPIKGIRVKCDDCVDYDMCWDCFKTSKVSKAHTTDHAVIVHLSPTNRKFDPDSDVVVLEDNNKKGCFGSVKKVRYKGKVCALKTIRLDGAARDVLLIKSYQNELFAYNELHSNRIIKFYGHAKKEFEDHVELYLLMEYMNKGSLKDALASTEKFSLRRKFQWILTIIQALRRMHAKGFVHKDIKPDNILLNSHNNIKVADMGIAIHDRGRGYFSDNMGPLLYSAPELLLEGDEGVMFNTKADIYSFGLIVYEIFTHKQINMFIKLLSLRKLIFTTPAQVFMPLVEKCVRFNPDERPTAQNICEKLEAFDNEFWDSLNVSEREYMNMETDKKDEIFLHFYESVGEHMFDSL